MWPELDSRPVSYVGWICCWFSPCSTGMLGGRRYCERSPPTTNWVRFPDPSSHVGWVGCWFLSLLQGFFSWFPGFPPSTKTNTPNPNSIRAFDHHVMLKCALQVLSIYFSPGSPFHSLHKTNSSKFQLDQDGGPTWKPAKADAASSLNNVNWSRSLMCRQRDHRVNWSYS